MPNNIELLDEFLTGLGYDTSAKKSLFQQNEEMSSILLTFMMAEIDALRARIEELEAKLNGQ